MLFHPSSQNVRLFLDCFVLCVAPITSWMLIGCSTTWTPGIPFSLAHLHLRAVLDAAVCVGAHHRVLQQLSLKVDIPRSFIPRSDAVTSHRPSNGGKLTKGRRHHLRWQWREKRNITMVCTGVVAGQRAIRILNTELVANGHAHWHYPPTSRASASLPRTWENARPSELGCSPGRERAARDNGASLKGCENLLASPCRTRGGINVAHNPSDKLIRISWHLTIPLHLKRRATYSRQRPRVWNTHVQLGDICTCMRCILPCRSPWQSKFRSANLPPERCLWGIESKSRQMPARSRCTGAAAPTKQKDTCEYENESGRRYSS